MKTVMHLGKGTLFCLLLPYWNIQWKTVLAPVPRSPLRFRTAQVSACRPSPLRASYLLCNPPGARCNLLYETYSKHAEKERGGFFPSGWGLLKFPWHWPQNFFQASAPVSQPA